MFPHDCLEDEGVQTELLASQRGNRDTSLLVPTYVGYLTPTDMKETSNLSQCSASIEDFLF